MGLFPRRPFARRPTTSLPLERGERVLALARVGERSEVVATTTRLAVVRPGETWQRRWPQVDSVTWDEEERELQVSDVRGGGTTLHLPGDDHLDLARVVRERVQSTLVTATSVVVPGGQVRLAVRKDGGRLVLQEVPDPGADTSGEDARRGLARARRELASSLGVQELPPAEV